MMKGTLFRFKTLLELYQKTEDMLTGEIVRLQAEKAKVIKKIQSLHREEKATRRSMASGGEGRDIQTTLHYVQRLSQCVEEAKKINETLEVQVEARMEELHAAKRERKRFEILKDHSVRAAEKRMNRQEQKLLDDYSQRKTYV